MSKVTFCSFCRAEYDEEPDSQFFGFCSEECMYEAMYGSPRRLQPIHTKSDYEED